ncbi:MAG: cofactor assembly of complex C subunit B [Pseudanabaenaceae cyanobacterium]
MIAYSFYSALILTLLLLMGLFFFLRASTKDRTESYTLTVTPEVVGQIQQYLHSRGYQLLARSPMTATISWRGRVRASVGLAVLLGGLAGVGVGCLGLVLAVLIPPIWNETVEILAVLSAIAGTVIFYWRGANREETVQLIAQGEDRLTIQAHRDEITELRQRLQL